MRSTNDKVNSIEQNGVLQDSRVLDTTNLNDGQQ